jgi:tetratricopeptide (TPR) repeat protein
MINWHDEMEAKASLILGVLLEDAGEPECAAKLFRRALSRQHDLVEARVRLGFTCWQMEDSGGMYEAFSEAVRLDSQAARSAALEKPEEARLIHPVLYPRQYGQTLTVDWERAVPVEVKRSSQMMWRAQEHLAEARDAEARDVLELMLKHDAEDPYPIPLLVLTYLLLMASENKEGFADGKESMLRTVEPGLARLLFQS